MYKYEGIIRKLILNYKFNDCSYLYKTFEKCLINNKNVCQFLNGYDIIIPVPLHKKRLRKRGYNQAELITRELAKDINDNANKKYILDKNKKGKAKYIQNKNIILLNNVLIKNKNIKPQSEKGIIQRKTDVKGIYEVKNMDNIKNKRIVLFDDIYTTGSTAGECKRVLLEAGALDVGILALAKDYVD